jgi:murein DD-endopeptidase MepM/ murein hydrolase activator NlpD
MWSKKFLLVSAFCGPIALYIAMISDVVDIYTNVKAPGENPATVQLVLTAPARPATTTDKYGFPFYGPTDNSAYLVRDFGVSQDSRGRTYFSNGVGLAAPADSPVFSTHDGKVLFVGRKGGYGLQVEVENALGVKTRYSHLGSSIVEEGQVVRQGEQIGLVGKTGLVAFPQLQYQVLMADHPVDPMVFINNKAPTRKISSE